MMIRAGQLEHQRPGEQSHTLRTWQWPALIAGALLLLYLPLLVHAVQVWSADQELSFGFAVPPIAAVMVWLRRGEIKASISDGAWPGLLLVLIGLGVLLMATRLSIYFLLAVSVPFTVAGVAIYLYGIALARLLLFPTMLVAAALGLYHGLLNSVGFAMQHLTAAGAAGAANLIGLPVHRSGVDLFAPHFHFVVAEACSGMDSLLALLCMAMIVVGIVRASRTRRALLVALVPPIILLSNTLRVTVVLLLSQSLGERVVQDPLHAVLSGSVFVFASVLFIASVAALRCLPPLSVTHSSPS